MLIFTSMLIILGCNINEISMDENEIKTEQLKLDTTGVYKMKDIAIFKNYLKDKFNKENFKSIEYTKILEDNQNVNIINRDNKISYSTLVEKGDSVFEFLIYTKKDKKEQFIIAELVSDNDIQFLNLHTFTGRVTFRESKGKILGIEKFENGIPIKDYNKSVICGSVSTPVSCVSGLHFPGEPCAYSGGSGAAYYDTFFVMCADGGEYINPDWGGGGGSYGSGGNLVNPYDLTSPQALNYIIERRGGSFLSSGEINFLNSNPAIGNSLKYYFLDDQNYPNSTDFLHWTINFFIQNPTATWPLFKNWFITKSEGIIGEYKGGISDELFSHQIFQQHSLPPMAQYELAFPSRPNVEYPDYYRDSETNTVVYNNYIGGRLKQLFNQNGGDVSTNPFYNACAARQSYAHNKLGIMIPFQHNDLKGDYGWNYILKASLMGIFLEKTYGTPTHQLVGSDANDLNKIKTFLQGKTGIYLVINKNPDIAGYTGHTDMIKNRYVSGGANVTNSSGTSTVNGGIKHIYIWELH